MTLFVYTERRNIFIESDERPTVIKHHIPKRNPYFKEELKRFIKEIQGWLLGEEVDVIQFVMQREMTFHHRALYSAIIRASFRTDGLCLLDVRLEGEEDITDASACEHELEV